MKDIFSILLILFSFLSLHAQNIKAEYFDGPYLSTTKQKVHLKWIEKGVLKDSVVLKENASFFDRPQLPKVDLSNLNFTADIVTNFDLVSKFVALSDIHGQHDLFLKCSKCMRLSMKQVTGSMKMVTL